ncbi:class I SAM-dependent methyltransferase [Nonomuraea sp. NPDC050536]|uniref:class I SAM-dependent methyltransferase n=1 Tax=Nonomuraea sp. NPDC050536 TaxID=3364366 RepID=UPI0037C66A3C
MTDERPTLDELVERWRSDLEAWAIPTEILAGAATPPWVMPSPLFGRRADEQLEAPHGHSYQAALNALPEGGTVLDVGAGAGAASLPLAVARHGSIIAIDTSRDMLTGLAERAQQLDVPARLIAGRWPEASDVLLTRDEGEVADVVVCHNVLYNIRDLPPFLLALDRCAGTRVVIELTEVPPPSALNPLWARFHGLSRPDRPTAAAVFEIVEAMGLRPKMRSWAHEVATPYDDFAAAVEITRIRLCLPEQRSGEVADALLELGVDPGEPYLPGTRQRNVVTIWWDHPTG